jgi:hypothetical protein
MKDFFISYTKADRSWAEWIAWQLEEAGYTTMLQAWDFGPGSNFVHKMHDAATDAGRTVAVLSPDYLTSKFSESEWAAAFAKDPTGEKGLLLPVRVRECSPKGLLPQVVYIDLVGQNDDMAAREVLLSGAKRGRKKPTIAPAFPGAPQRVITKRPRFPGALPSIWNIPHQRNPNFTGREDFLAEMQNTLISAPAVAVTGLGGIGKTQVIIEYAIAIKQTTMLCGG